MRRRLAVTQRLGQREPRRSRLPIRALVEGLEDRCLLATFPVTTTLDNGSNISPIPGSLRAAILAANLTTAIDDITFQLAGGPAPFTISLPTPLPAITDPVIIDARTQAGFAGTPIVVLNGLNAGPAADGFQLFAGSNGSTIRGFVIQQFGGDGISILGSGSHVVAGNYIGTDVTGTTSFNALGQSLGNTSDGLEIAASSSNNTIGGTAVLDRNLISGNLGPGIRIAGSGNSVQGNFIGTNAAGTATRDAVGRSLGNTGDGVAILASSATGNTIGGTSAGARNVISGNGLNGVALSPPPSISPPGPSGNLVQGNFIGTNATGTATRDAAGNSLGNGAHGVFLGGASSNTIGGTITGARNVISGNGINGVTLSGTGTTGNLVQGNFIGTDATGTAIQNVGGQGLGNASNGVLVSDAASGNTIGGTTTAARNVISGNGGSIVQFSGNGVQLIGTGTTGNLVQGNFIGTDVNGTRARPNTNSGVRLLFGASGNTIGGALVGAGNLLSGNSSAGVEIATSGNFIQGNIIGLDATGTTSIGADGNRLGNVGTGIVAGNVAGNQIGGTTAAARNLISGNGAQGIFFSGSVSGNNPIEGNYIGTDITGTTSIDARGNSLGNGLSGILLLNSAGHTIGGTSAASRNLISGNLRQPGISLTGTNTQNNLVLNNFIGTDVTGNAAIGGTAARSNVHGVVIDSGASNNTIGQVGAGNTVAFNFQVGVFVVPTSGPTVAGNSIVGNTLRNNGTDGVLLENAFGNSIVSNAIFANGFDGVRVDGGARNSILSNSTFANANLAIELLNGGNNNQPAPVLTSATSAGGSTTIQGTLQAAPNTSYRIQFFASAASPPPGFGQGQTFLGEIPPNQPLTTNASGLAVINVTLPVAVAADQFLTATATNLTTQGTSAFSRTSPNLSVTKTAPAPVLQGQNLTYTINVANNGASPTPGVSLIDTLPAGTTFVSASGGATPVGNTLTFPVGTLVRGASATFTIVVRADAAGTITNTARVTTSEDARNPDLNPSDNVATVNTTVTPVANLAVTKTADRNVVPQFDDLTYTVRVTNSGPSPSNNVALTDVLPAGATFVSASGGATPLGNTLTFPIGTLAVGASSTFAIVVRPTVLGPNVNNASVTSTTFDGDTSNNLATLTNEVVRSFTVTTTADSGPGSLRQAILSVNSDTANPAPIAITFAIPGPRPSVIALSGPLPSIAHPVIIDGTSEIIVDGSGIGTSVKPAQVADSPALLVVNARNSLVAGLTLRGYDGFGIKLDVSSGDVTLANNRIIGSGPAGGGANTRRLGGVLVLSDRNTIGDNVIAGDGYGVYLSGAAATANTLVGNYIGTDRDGTAMGGTAGRIDGIAVDGASDNLIGPRNLIVDYLTGIYVFGGSTRNLIRGNTIRDTADAPAGDTSVENGGVLVTNANGNTIGGPDEADGNTIENIRGSGVVLFNGATDNTVSFNTIRNSTGAGVYLFNAPGNRVGVVGAGNTITGNEGTGVQLEGALSRDNRVQANLVARNNQDGVYLFNAPANVIGGAATGEGNDIRNNRFSGVHIEGTGATDNIVQGNTIVASQVFGVLLEGRATRNTIGGTGGAANTFVGNGSRPIQVLIDGNPPSGADQSGGNTIAGNTVVMPDGAAMTTRGIGKTKRFKLLARKHARPGAGRGIGRGHQLYPAGPRHLLKQA